MSKFLIQVKSIYQIWKSSHFADGLVVIEYSEPIEIVLNQILDNKRNPIKSRIHLEVFYPYRSCHPHLTLIGFQITQQKLRISQLSETSCDQ